MTISSSSTSQQSAATEIEQGQRFGFGENWARFLSTLNDERILEAETSLKSMLECENLQGLRFLDMGCGSGLFSLAAHRLGATVVSIDFDPKSVACAQTLKKNYADNSETWTIRQGSILDQPFVKSLGTFDVVYSWGVLHHTGNMWEALTNIMFPISNHGKLFIAIYNDQGWQSKAWWKVKKIYCSGFLGKFLICSLFIPYFFLKVIIKAVFFRINAFQECKRDRGMSLFHNWTDWLGGFPFEVASPEALFNFYKKHGFRLLSLKTTNSSGNNQLVFVRE